MSHPFDHSSSDPYSQALDLIKLARQDLINHERLQARRRAERAAALAPHLEDPWLILAALASPKASVAYLQRALEINPSSGRAQKGMQWALQRLEQQLPAVKPADLVTDHPASQSLAEHPQPAAPSFYAAPVRKRTVVPVYPVKRKQKTAIPAIFYYAFFILFLSLALFALSLVPYYPRAIASLPSDQITQFPILETIAAYSFEPTEPVSAPTESVEEMAGILLPSTDSLQTAEPDQELAASPTPLPTELPTATPTDQPTATPLPTETPVPTELPTPEPTFTSTPVPTNPALTPEPQVQPTKKHKKKQVAASPGFRPEGVSLNDRWIDVDLSAQRTYAMQGDQIVNSFIVSTGRWPTVTVTGVFKIYVKYRQANMSGDDYFLPNVPNVMYFFKGYGLHGTYWHNNFGTPMSHGCVNLSPSDSDWLFDFASVGTFVSVHE